MVIVDLFGLYVSQNLQLHIKIQLYSINLEMAVINLVNDFR